MKLLTMQEIELSIMEETRDVDPEITEGLILKEAVIPRSEIVKLQTKLHIGTLSQLQLGKFWFFELPIRGKR